MKKSIVFILFLLFLVTCCISGCGLITGKIDVKDDGYSLSREQEQMYQSAIITKSIECDSLKNIILEKDVELLVLKEDSLECASNFDKFVVQVNTLKDSIEYLLNEIDKLNKSKTEPSWIK